LFNGLLLWKDFEVLLNEVRVEDKGFIDPQTMQDHKTYAVNQAKVATIGKQEWCIYSI
jgi:hypothetical protein